MEEKTLIYVAGNPDAYPLEYFDKDTQTYAGVIPELLAEFSGQSTYEIVYYEADGTDHREALAQQKQVDLFSGYEAEEEQLDHAHELPLFSGENAKISASDVDLSVIPPEITKFFTAAFVLFIIALVFALLTLLIGLFTKKKGLAASFSLLGLVSLFSANKCFSYIAQQLVSGKISPSSLLSSLKSLADYKDYLSFVNIDVRIFELSSAYTLMMIIFGAVIIFNIIFMLAEKSA